MNISQQTPPQASLEALKKTSANLFPVDSSLAAILSHIHDFPQQHSPHPTSVVELQDMADENVGLRKARNFGWEYLSEPGSKEKYAVQVHSDADGSNHRFAELNRSSAAEELITLLDKIQSSDQDGTWTFSVLTSPAQDIACVWLHDTVNKSAKLIVIAPVRPFLKPWPKTYTDKEFEDSVRDDAVRKLHENPDEPDENAQQRSQQY
jgi:hypothetical protein